MRELRSHIQEKAFHIKRNNIKTAVMEALAKARATQVPASENVAMRNSDKTRVKFFFFTRATLMVSYT